MWGVDVAWNEIVGTVNIHLTELSAECSLPSLSHWSGDGLVASQDGATSLSLTKERPSMRLPFFDPPREEVAAMASDLIIRFGLRARDEALYLAGLSEQMRARWNT
jgi:hypothetical protein